MGASRTLFVLRYQASEAKVAKGFNAFGILTRRGNKIEEIFWGHIEGTSWLLGEDGSALVKLALRAHAGAA